MNGRPSNAAKESGMFPVKLVRNYVPRGEYEIIGYDKPSVEVKDAAGRWVELEKAEFVKGEMPPPAYPGTGYDNKIWRNTHLNLPKEEARDIIDKGIAERADAIP